MEEKKKETFKFASEKWSLDKEKGKDIAPLTV